MYSFFNINKKKKEKRKIKKIYLAISGLVHDILIFTYLCSPATFYKDNLYLPSK